MSKKDKINKEVEKTLVLLDDSQPLKADAYFYTRLKARMDAEKKESQFKKLSVGWKVFAPAFMLVIVFMNIYTASVVLRRQTSSMTKQDELVSLVATEFMLDSDQYNPTLILNQ